MEQHKESLLQTVEANLLISIEIPRVFSFIAQSLPILIQTDEANLLISIQISRKFLVG